ncbi:MAG TPA: hypothetical protein VJT49_33570 [Amycolatopsis sp.]|uniref:hypothetical protein n=1 Tax=Amycolatopsis sp. TaxID=37632 RepID=UPI002B47F238|nr:hypothetical protein [Amycolatopsis sp.]HKS49954.1 hypothetical protein [Amycolatopsis sp.]
MILRTEFAVLGSLLRALAEAWRALEVSVVEDRPPGEGLAVADRLAEVVADGSAELSPVVDSGALTGESLHAAATALVRLRRSLDEDLRSHTAVSDVLHAVRGRDSQWRGWARSILSGAGRCAESLYAAENAMLRCWREVAEVAELNKYEASR